MVVNQKDKKDNKSKMVKKQPTQVKESKALRLIKERKRKAQLRTNPALSIYESGRERTKRVVKKEYPLVNINKLPAKLNKGNDNIGVVWKNTNKIQSHTLFNLTNLPFREPASKSDAFYYVAPFKEPKSVNIVDELKKCKLNLAKENQNRYSDIQEKIKKTKSLKSKVYQSDKLKSNIPTSFINNNGKVQKDFVDKTYEESLKNNIIPLISTFSTNPLTKGRIMTEMGFDNISTTNNDSLHRVKKKISKNKSNILKTSENLLMNKNIFNDNFGSLLNNLQPLDSLISPKQINNNGLITKQNIPVTNLDFVDEPLDLSKIKLEEELLLNDQIMNDVKDDDLLSLLTMSQKEEDDVVNGSLLLPPILMNSEYDFGSVPTKPLLPVPKRSSGTLDDILAPFKVNSRSSKPIIEESKMNKTGFSSFNYFNFDEMKLPKIELPQNIKSQKNNSLFNNEYDNSALVGNENLIDHSMLKKEFIPTNSNKIFQEKNFSTGGLDDIANFGNNNNNMLSSKIKSEKIEDIKLKQNLIINGVDMSKVKHEFGDGMVVDISNNPSGYTVDSVGSNLMNVDNTLLNNIITTESLLEMNPSLAPSTLLSNNTIAKQNMAIDCYNAELNFLNSSYALQNSLDYPNNILNNNSTIPPSFTCNTIKNDINEFNLDTISCNDLNAKNTLKESMHCCANNIPLATTTSSTIKTIPDWYNQGNINLVNPDACTINEEVMNSPRLIKPLIPTLSANTPEKMFSNTINEPLLSGHSKEVMNDPSQFTSFLDSEIPLPFTESNVNGVHHHQEDEGKLVQASDEENIQSEELPESIINEIIDRLANDDKLKDMTSDSCVTGQNLQDTCKMLKKLSEEIDKLVNNSEQLEASEKKWKEWRKDILAYENEAHQWLNARIEFYSRRVNEYRKDWIEYWIKRYLMQHKQQIKTLSYYINIPQNLQFATSLCLDSDNASTPSSTTTTNLNATTNITTTNNTEENMKSKSIGHETIKQFKRSSTSLVALIADVDRDPRLEVIGRTIDVANKDLLSNPKLIDEYHETLLTEKKLLEEKYDIVDSLNIVPSNVIKPITNDHLMNKNERIIQEGDSNSKGYHQDSENKDVVSVLIDEYVKSSFESKRIFIHGIPKDYQLMFNDKMKSLIFILDKCIQDKKDLINTMKENRKEYSITNEA